MQQKILNFIFLAILLSACAPQVQNLPDPGAKTQFGPLHQDTAIEIPADNQLVVQWNMNQTPAKSLFRVAENLLSLDLTSPFPDQLLASLPRGSEEKTLEHSLYLEFIKKQAGPSGEKSLSAILPQLESDNDLISENIIREGLDFHIPSEAKLEDTKAICLDFVKLMDKNIENYKIHPEVKAILRQKIQSEIARLDKLIEEGLGEISTAQSLSKTISPIAKILKSEDIKLDAVTTQDLEFGKTLGLKIDNFKNSQGALNVLIEIWNKLTPEERKSNFASVSQEFYEYLQGQDASALNCLQDSSCLNPIKFLAKEVGIFPKIERLGIENLRSTLNKEARKEALHKLRSGFASGLQDLPKMLAKTIHDQFSVQIEQLRDLGSHFSERLGDRFAKWSEMKFRKNERSIFDLRATSARVSYQRESIHLRWLQSDQPPSNETLSSFRSFLTEMWEKRELSAEVKISTHLGQIEQLVQNYSNSTSTLNPSQLSLDAHIESLRSFSKLLAYFQDWRSNGYEQSLGQFRARELFPEFDSKELDAALFPKDAMMILSFSSLGKQLQAITDPLSPVFMIDLDNKITWADQFEFNSAKPSVMAGIIDRQNSKDTKHVKSEKVSRYILALAQFVRSVEQIEKSKSSYLFEKLESGKTVMETALEARGKIRLLILALANFLSHQLKPSGDLVIAELDVTAQQPASKEAPVALDQFLAIHALLEAADVLGVQLYSWEAQDIYYSMNAKMFNQKTLFYGHNTADLVTLTEGAVALRALSQKLPSRSKDQLNLLLQRWEVPLQNLQLK